MLKVADLTSDQLLEVTRTANELTSTLDKSQLINLILAKAGEISGCAGVCLVLFSELPHNQPEVYPHGLSKGCAESIPSLSCGSLKENLLIGGYELLNDLPGSCADGFRSATCFSLVTHGNAGGLLYFFGFENPLFTKSQIECLQFFSSFAATALENARRYAEKDREVRKLNILNNTIFSLSLESDIQSLCQKLSNHAASLLGSETAYLILFHQETKRFKELYISGDTGSEPLDFQPPAHGTLSRVLTSDKVMMLKSEELTDALMDLPLTLPLFTNLMTVSLVHQESPIGILLLTSRKNGTPFSNKDNDLFLTYASHAALSIENTRMLEQTREQAITDGLTGLFNHRKFQSSLQNEIMRSLRYKHSLSVLMIDIDNFKTLNDAYGHPEGDNILKEVTQIIRASIREVDIPARYGGEEFAVILPETSSEHGRIVAERIRSRIHDTNFAETGGKQGIRMTVSIGASTFPEDGLKREELISKCDQALYFAKREGKNCVRRYDETLKSFIDKRENNIDLLLKDPKIKVMRDLAAAVDAKNLYTRGHTDEVVQYAVTLARILKLSAEDIESIRLAGILHDIGTVSIPEEILNKSGPLSEEERKVVESHPELGEMILKKASRLENIIPAILYHHERFDGKGYPDGLKGEEIPIHARILGVAEAYQAMISERPYRPKLSKSEAMHELCSNAGTQFDPGIVEAFFQVVS